MKCARCQAPMKSLQQACRDCGWTRGTNPDDRDGAPARGISKTWGDGFCDWHFNGKRCTEDAVKLQDGRRWCHWHRALASPEENNKMSRDLEVYGAPKVPGRGPIPDPAPPPVTPYVERTPGADDDRGEAA